MTGIKELCTVVTEKQREAMKEAKVDYVYMTGYEIIYAEVKNCRACDKHGRTA